MKIKTLVNEFLVYEKKYTLFSFKFKSFPVWAHYRMYFYYAFTKDRNLLESSNVKNKLSLNYILQSMNIFNLKRLLKKSDYFVLQHPRSTYEKKDIYTEEIVDLIGQSKCSLFSFSENGNMNKQGDVIYLDIIKGVAKLFSKVFYVMVMNKYFKSDFKYFVAELNIERNKYLKHYKRYYIELVMQYYFYYFLLKLKRIKKVILVVSYYNMPLVFAAKSLKLEVIEMQHGVISEYHLGYHFPYYEGDFFPDVLVIFNTYWENVAMYPVNTTVVSVGNTYLSQYHQKTKKTKKTILIISQTTIGKKLEHFILNNIGDLKDFQIYFKLHPNEFSDKNNKYKALMGVSNIMLVTNEKSIPELQLFCEYQVGIYSTAIYEGLEQRCKTLLLNDAGIEYMEQLINDNIVSCVEYESKISDILPHMKNVKKLQFFDTFNEHYAKGIFDE
jgi:hypothetical protein